MTRQANKNERKNEMVDSLLAHYDSFSLALGKLGKQSEMWKRKLEAIFSANFFGKHGNHNLLFQEIGYEYRLLSQSRRTFVFSKPLLGQL